METVLAVATPAPNVTEPTGYVTSGGAPWGFVVFLLLGVACVLLYLSMRRHLRRVPPTFGPAAEPPAVSEDPRPPAPKP